MPTSSSRRACHGVHRQRIRSDSPTPPRSSSAGAGLSVEREGYIRKDQDLHIQAGQSDRLEIELEPSPDTGFELTSDEVAAITALGRADGRLFDGDPTTHEEM